MPRVKTGPGRTGKRARITVGQRDFNGVRFPARIERFVAELPWYVLEVSSVRVNQAAAFVVPAEVAGNPAPSVAQVDVTELAPGVWNLGGGSHNSVVIEQQPSAGSNIPGGSLVAIFIGRFSG